MSNQSLKRSYGTSSTAPFQAAPPLPPGPPPPAPSQPAPAVNPYANYGYAYPTPPVAQAAPGYAGYGYGGAPAPAQPQYGYAQPPTSQQQQQYAHPQPAYASHQFPQQPQFIPPPPPPPGYAPPPPPQHAVQQGQSLSYPSYPSYPPQQQFQPQIGPAYYPQPLSLTPLAQNQHSGSPSAPPPFKRPRYDSTGALQGPPPIQNSGQEGHGSVNGYDNGRGRGRGGYDRGGRGGGGRGGYREGNSNESRSESGGSPGPSNSRGGYRGRGAERGSYGRGGGNHSNGRENGNGGSLRGVPSGPSDRGSRGRGRGGSDRGNSRPMSGLPTATSSNSNSNSNQFDPSLPKGPRSSNVNPRTPLGNRSAKKSGTPGYSGREERKEENKKTLTDFRIGELSLEELEWSWLAEKSSMPQTESEVIEEKVEEEGGDMSIEAIEEPLDPDISIITSEIEEPTKKLSKSQKKAMSKKKAAAKKILDESLAIEEKEVIVVEEAENTERVEILIKVGEPITEVEVEENKESEELAKKKDIKHKRDEDEDSESSNAAVLAAKKVKADNGQSLNSVSPPLPASNSSTVESVEPKVDVIKPEMVIPTGPKEKEPSVFPPLGVENSRLRIYFSSPIEIIRKVIIPASPVELNLSKKSIKVDSEEEKKDVEGEVDVDGEKMPEEMTEESIDIVQDNSDQSDTEEVISTSLLGKKIITPILEESTPAPDEARIEVNSIEAKEKESIETVAEITEKEIETIPSPDRMSISYAKNTRRIVVDATIIESVEIHRKEGKIEIMVKVEEAKEEKFRICRGIIVEQLNEATDEYQIISKESLSTGSDPLLPPLHHLFNASDSTTDSITISSTEVKGQFKLIANLDRLNPLTEARWVKTGDIEGWITQLGLGILKPEISQWKGKIRVVDPDPPPTIESALESWSTTSQLGSLLDRTKFIQNHLLPSIDNTLEILLRLTRPSIPPPQAPALSVLAANLDAPYPNSQTQISLAVLAMFRLSVETAKKGTRPKEEVEEVEKGVREIVRGIPYYLIFKSLDGMFRDWRGGKKVGSLSSSQ